jgi:hypothetical protein
MGGHEGLVPAPVQRVGRDQPLGIGLGHRVVASIVDSVVSVPGGQRDDDDLIGALLYQLAVIRPLVNLAGGLRLVRRGAGTYLLSAATSAPRVALAVVTSAAGRADAYPSGYGGDVGNRLILRETPAD